MVKVPFERSICASSYTNICVNFCKRCVVGSGAFGATNSKMKVYLMRVKRHVGTRNAPKHVATGGGKRIELVFGMSVVAVTSASRLQPPIFSVPKLCFPCGIQGFKYLLSIDFSPFRDEREGKGLSHKVGKDH